MPNYDELKGVVNVIVYKINVLGALKEAGYNITRLRNEKLLKGKV